MLRRHHHAVIGGTGAAARRAWARSRAPSRLLNPTFGASDALRIGETEKIAATAFHITRMRACRQERAGPRDYPRHSRIGTRDGDRGKRPAAILSARLT